MESPLPISVCTLCLNEADRLPRTLQQVDKFAQWLIFDTGSTDNSIQLARDAGAEVEEHSWEGFSVTRIKHFSRASRDWILWIDADETITPELLDELKQLFSKPLEHAAYRINRMICFEGKWIKHGDWFPDYNVRLFHRDCWSMEERAVHESLDIKGTIGTLEALLEHHSFRSWEDKEQRSVRYAELWATMQAEKGKKASAFSPAFRAGWKLFRGFILKRGFLDGPMGWRVALSNARETHLKYSLLRQENQNT